MRGHPDGTSRAGWITSLRGDGVTVGLPWMSYSTNRDWLPLLVSCVEARSAGASDTVASALPPVTACARR